MSTYLVSPQLSVTSSAAYWFPTSHPLWWGKRQERSQGGAAEGLGPLKAHPGARSQGLSCGTWSARTLLRHITSLTASGEEIFFVLTLCLLFVQWLGALCRITVIFLCDSSGPNHLVEHYGIQKLSLLREFCLKTGVQVTRI